MNGIIGLGCSLGALPKTQEVTSSQFGQMGYAFSRAICLSVGMIHPAYKHFKFLKARAQLDTHKTTLEDDEGERFNQHWIAMATFLSFELLADYFIFW